MVLVTVLYSLVANAFTSWPLYSQFIKKSLLPYHLRYSPPLLYGNHFFPLCSATISFAAFSSYREGSFGLGAGKLRTIFKIVLPAAVPGILSGVILATGRIVGETAALIYTAGTVAKIPNSAFSSGRTLAVHMYLLANEGLHVNQAYATAVILLILVIGINALSSFIAKKISKA